MPLTKLGFQPGINNELTPFSNQGGWEDGDLIRFRLGFPEKIGGWTRFANTSFLGSCRSLHSWVSVVGDRYLGIGTSSKFYLETGASFYDITPNRLTLASPSSLSSSSGSTITITTPSSHGAVLGDFVTISGAASLGGNMIPTVLNQEYNITSVSSATVFTIEARAANTTIPSITVDGQLTPSPVVRTSSDTGNGGSSVSLVFQINTGLDTTILGNGWGAGSWNKTGRTWGSAAVVSVVSQTLRLYSQDNYGEDLLINPRNGSVYYWDASGSVTNRAVALQDLAGASSVPTVCRQILVSDTDGHVIAFGCDPESTPGVLDPLTIRFSSQRSITEWSSLDTTTAGEVRLGSGSEIVCAIETRQQILVFTDTALYTMQYLGPPFIFGLTMVSENTSVASPNAAIAVDDTVFWMGLGEFYVFSGTVQRAPCTVRDYVFNDFNTIQYEKVVSGANSKFGEVWWFYPSADSDINNRYVVFNYLENIWYYGSLTRTAWLDQGTYDFPVAAATDNYLYFQENGFNDGSVNPSAALTSFITSSPLTIGDGENFTFVSRLLPDVTFRNSSESTPTLKITTRVRNKSEGAFVKETLSEINADTEIVDLRLRGRQMSIDVRSTEAGTTWRLGTLRYDLREDGTR